VINSKETLILNSALLAFSSLSDLIARQLNSNAVNCSRRHRVSSFAYSPLNTFPKRKQQSLLVALTTIAPSLSLHFSGSQLRTPPPSRICIVVPTTGQWRPQRKHDPNPHSPPASSSPNKIKTWRWPISTSRSHHRRR
jgi:hypothetical protein